MTGNEKLSVYLDIELSSEVAALAEEEDRSTANMIRVLIREAIEARKVDDN